MGDNSVSDTLRQGRAASVQTMTRDEKPGTSSGGDGVSSAIAGNPATAACRRSGMPSPQRVPRYLYAVSPPAELGGDTAVW